MRLDARAFGLAAAVMAGTLFVVCALGVAIAPGATTAFAGYLIHADLSGLTRSLTLASFVGGLVCWTAGTGLAFWFMGVVYNRLAGAQMTAGLTSDRVAAQRA